VGELTLRKPHCIELQKPYMGPTLRVIQSIRGAMMDHTGNIITTNKKRRSTLSNYSLSYHYDILMCIPSFGMIGLGGKVSAAQLTQQWKISLDVMTKTIKATMQHGVRTVLHNTLHRR